MTMLALRPAAASDSKILFDWRNDAITRANSLTSAVIPFEEHEAWLKVVIADSTRLLFIALENGIPVGTLRADMNQTENTMILSWTVAPEHRGRGVGTRILEAGCQKFAHFKLLAKIKSENAASIRMAVSCGFAKDVESDGVQTWSRSASIS